MLILPSAIYPSPTSASNPAPAVKPDSMDPPSLAGALIAVNVVFLVLMVTVVSIRVYTKGMLLRTLGWDDCESIHHHLRVPTHIINRYMYHSGSKLEVIALLSRECTDMHSKVRQYSNRGTHDPTFAETMSNLDSAGADEGTETNHGFGWHQWDVPMPLFTPSDLGVSGCC